MTDAFVEAVICATAARVANRCSNPNCRALTSGPHNDRTSRPPRPQGAATILCCRTTSTVRMATRYGSAGIARTSSTTTSCSIPRLSCGAGRARRKRKSGSRRTDLGRAQAAAADSSCVAWRPALTYIPQTVP